MGASYTDIVSIDPSSYTCDADAPYFIAGSLILSANIFDDVAITDIEVWSIDVCGVTSSTIIPHPDSAPMLGISAYHIWIIFGPVESPTYGLSVSYPFVTDLRDP